MHPFTHQNLKNGFTIVELLISISIIGLLASIVLAAVNEARDDAKIAITVQEIREVQKAVLAYYFDTGQFPPKCVAVFSATNNPACVPTTDPLQTNVLGVPNWNGPYIDIYSLKHGWGGDIGINNEWDFFADGTNDGVIILNDDVANATDNAGQIPSWALLRIDQILDDGNLTTGEIRSNVSFACVPGELCIRYDDGQ